MLTRKNSYGALADVLDRAANYMDTHGKCRDVLERPNGKVCAIGAIRRACGVSNDVDDLSATLDQRRLVDEASWIVRICGVTGGGYRLDLWSDIHNKTQVVKGLRTAARWARKWQDEEETRKNDG